MPITKVPVVHKFGIISSSQRLELQERLLKQTYLTSLKSKKAALSQRNPLEVTDEFVQLYNSVEDLDEKEKYEEKARKLLERSKRRCGVKNCGHGSHVNLPLAWTEMAQLAQCKGRIQEECLDTLVTSLDVSPLAKYHIPALFFLAETMLYWLRTEAVLQPFLRTAEIKLLRMGQLVFERLFYHHMAGQLQGHTESKSRLCTYIDGLQDCQAAYNPYPNALLSLRFVIEVGKIILADSQLDPGDIKEGDKIPEAPKHNLDEVTSATKEMYDRRAHDDSRSIHSGAISSSVHDLSPTLWHALDVWRCTNSLSGGLREALKALAHCGLGLASETWIDGIVAIQILGETAKTNMAAMKVLHRLAQGVKTTEDLLTPPLSSRSGGSDMFSISSDGDDLELALQEQEEQAKMVDSQASVYSSKASLSDIYERSEEGEGDKKNMTDTSEETISTCGGKSGSSHQSQEDRISQKEHDEAKSGSPKEDKPADESQGAAKGAVREVSFHESALNNKSSALGFSRDAQNTGSKPNTRGETKLSTRPNTDLDRGTGWRANAGSEFRRPSDASSVPTYTNMPVSETPGITGWHWEVAITYTEVLSFIVLYGSTATIQKLALVGSNTDVDSLLHRRGGPNNNTDNNLSGVGNSQLSSAGLLDLAFFTTKNETDDGGPNDWSWRIRYGAIQSLVKICRCLEGDTNREGIRTTAWNLLLKANALERDSRVLEALKVGQVHTDTSNLLDEAFHERPASLGIRVASGLSSIYLPPIPPPSTAPPKKIPARPRPIIRQPVKAKAVGNKPVRTTLKQEVDLATALYEQTPDYNSRKSFDLRRIVEDQWRKEMQAKLEEEEEEELKALKEKQKEEEERQKQVMENKAKKFKPKDSGTAALHPDPTVNALEEAIPTLKLGLERNEKRIGSF